jgi:flagellar motor switch protein FliG
MSANADQQGAKLASTLSGVEKVAVLLLALGKARAAKLLRRFDLEDLQVLSHSVSDLRPITGDDLDGLVEEFGQAFSGGVKFVGTATEIKSLLSELMPGEEPPEAAPEKPAATSIWDRVSEVKVDAMRAYLVGEHPQTVAFILSRIDRDAAAKAISALPIEDQPALLCRMLAIGSVSDEVSKAVERRLEEDLLTTTGVESRASIADILNRLEKTQSEAVLQTLAEVRPDDAKAIKSLMFSFEDLVQLTLPQRTAVMDRVPVEQLVVALKGTDQAFQAIVLAALASRSRRMVEAELQSGSPPPPKEVSRARRAIVDVVLKMIAKGEIEPRGLDDDLKDIVN